MRGQSVCFVCGIRYLRSEGSECLFCGRNNLFCGVKGQSVCFVCGKIYLGGLGTRVSVLCVV